MWVALSDLLSGWQQKACRRTATPQRPQTTENSRKTPKQNPLRVHAVLGKSGWPPMTARVNQPMRLSRFELNSTCNGDDVSCAEENQYYGGISWLIVCLYVYICIGKMYPQWNIYVTLVMWYPSLWCRILTNPDNVDARICNWPEPRSWVDAFMTNDGSGGAVLKSILRRRTPLQFWL